MVLGMGRQEEQWELASWLRDLRDTEELGMAGLEPAVIGHRGVRAGMEGWGKQGGLPGNCWGAGAARAHSPDPRGPLT